MYHENFALDGLRLIVTNSKSRQWGNPFADKHNILTPGPGCQVFDCGPNDAGCYSTPGMSKVYGCPQPVNLEADICA